MPSERSTVDDDLEVRRRPGMVKAGTRGLEVEVERDEDKLQVLPSFSCEGWSEMPRPPTPIHRGGSATCYTLAQGLS